MTPGFEGGLGVQTRRSGPHGTKGTTLCIRWAEPSAVSKRMYLCSDATSITRGALENFIVRDIRGISTNPDNIVTLVPQSDNSIFREILVC